MKENDLMANWIGTTVIEKWKEGRRWLQGQSDDTAVDQNPEFSESNGALIIYMRKKVYFLEVVEADSRRANTIWVRDGQTKIGAVFTEASISEGGGSFRLKDFEIVINPHEKPESRVTLKIHGFDEDSKVRPARLSSATYVGYVEHIPGVQKLLKSLRQRQDRQSSIYGSGSEAVSSPFRSPTGELASPLSADFGTQAEFATQLPRISTERKMVLARESLFDYDNPMKDKPQLMESKPMPSPIRPQTGDRDASPLSTNSWSQAELSTQLPRINDEQRRALRTGPTLDIHQSMKNDLQTVFERPEKKERELSKAASDLLKLLEPTRPKKAVPIAHLLVKASTILCTKSKGITDVGEEEAVKPHELLQNTGSERLTNEHIHDLKPPTTVELPNQDLSFANPRNSGTLNTNGGLDDVNVLGDSEKENGELVLDDTGSNARLKLGALRASDDNGNTHEIGVSLEDNPYDGMKKIPRTWFKIPQDQLNILNSEDAWVNPSLPESVLQERRALQNALEPAEEVAEHRVGMVNKSVVYECDSEESDSESNKGEPLSEEENAYDDSKRTSGAHVADEAENDSEEGTKLYSHYFENKEPQRSYESTQDANQPKDKSITSSRHISPENELVSWPPTSPEREQRVDQGLDDDTLDDRISVIPESSHEHHVDQEPADDELDEDLSVIPESSIPEASLAMKMSAISPEKCSTSKFVQVAASNPAEEDDDEEEEMEMAEPSAFGNAVTLAEDHSSQVMDTMLDQQLMSSTFQEQAMVEVERTPRLKISRPKAKAQTTSSQEHIDTADYEISSNSVVPGTAEEVVPTSSTSQSDRRSPSARDHKTQQQLSQMQKLIRISNETSISSGHDRFSYDRDEQDIIPYTITEAEMVQESSPPENAGASTAYPTYEISGSASKPSMVKEVPNSSAESEASSSMKSESASIKRTLHEARLDGSSPPTKRKSLAWPVKFTPGTQSPVDLQKLKKLNRDDFLRENENSTGSPHKLPDIQHYSTERSVPTAVGANTNARNEDIAVVDSDREQGKNDNNSFSASDQDFQSTSASKKPANIYELYRQAYPSFTESVNAFIRWCVYIEWLTPRHLKSMLWDDFIHKVCHDYPKYVHQFHKNHLEDVVKHAKPFSAVQWYNDGNDFTYQKNIITRETLKEALALDAMQTKKARELFHKGEPRRLGSVNVSDPVSRPKTKAGSSIATSIVDLSNSDSSGDTELVDARAVIAAKQSIPLQKSPLQFSIQTNHLPREAIKSSLNLHRSTFERSVSMNEVDTNNEVRTSGSEGQKSPKGHFGSESKMRSSKPKERLHPASSSRQPSPELDFGIRASSLQREIAKAPVSRLASQLVGSKSFSRPRSRQPSFSSSVPTSPMEPRPRSAESVGKSVNKRRLSSEPPDKNEQMRKWINDPKRRRTIVNLAESESEK